MKKEEIKRIDIKEFREKGYLQEVNRQFLHPLGLALEVKIEDDGTEVLGGVWDYREDEEGIYYDIKNSEQNRIDNFTRNENYIKSEQKIIGDNRERKLGFIIEPIKEDLEFLKFKKSSEYVDSITEENQPTLEEIEIFIEQFVYLPGTFLSTKKKLLQHINSVSLNKILNSGYTTEEQEKYIDFRKNIVKIMKKL